MFDGLPSPLAVGRYHSLVAEPRSLPAELRATAWTEDGVLMAVEHRERPVYGVQFHPESILTEGGYTMLANFLRLAGLPCDERLSDLATGELRQVFAPRGVVHCATGNILESHDCSDTRQPARGSRTAFCWRESSRRSTRMAGRILRRWGRSWTWISAGVAAAVSLVDHLSESETYGARCAARDG